MEHIPLMLQPSIVSQARTVCPLYHIQVVQGRHGLPQSSEQKRTLGTLRDKSGLEFPVGLAAGTEFPPDVARQQVDREQVSDVDQTAVAIKSGLGPALRSRHKTKCLDFSGAWRCTSSDTSSVVTQPLYQRGWEDSWAGMTAWVSGVRRSPTCSVLRTASCDCPAFAQTGMISRSRRLRRRTFAVVAPVLPGSWASLPIAERVTTVLEFCLT